MLRCSEVSPVHSVGNASVHGAVLFGALEDDAAAECRASSSGGGSGTSMSCDTVAADLVGAGASVAAAACGVSAIASRAWLYPCCRAAYSSYHC